jgi:Fe-S-cluster containining protein
MPVRYECDQCGACCQGHLIVEAELLDFLREPRLTESDPCYAELSPAEVRPLLEDDSRCLVIACGKPCKFLGDDQRCTIYPTRPNGCVAMEAGDEQCQRARCAAGLLPLEPPAVEGDEVSSV